MASRGDIEAGRAFLSLYLKNTLTKQLTGVIGQARASLMQFSKITMTAGRALSKIGIAIGASFVAIASGNALVAQKAQLIHRTLANAIAPAVLPILERTLKIAQAFAQWASHNKNVLTTILRVGAWMVVIGSGLKLAAAAAKVLSAALLAVQIAVAKIGTMLATTWLGPLLLALGVLVAVTGAAYLLSSSFRHFFNENLADWATWAGNIKQSLNSIVSAITDGRFALAWRIALVTMQVEWMKFQNGVLFGWVKMFDLLDKLPGGGVIGGAMKGWLLEIRETLRGMKAEAERGTDMTSLKKELDRLRKDADKRLPFTPFSQAGQVKSTVTAGGAAAWTFGAAAQDIATKSYSELQAIKKAVWESARLMKEMAAKRERPGIFGK